MKRTRLVLGINAAYHQSAAAIVDSTGIIAAAEEERFNRVRHGKSTRAELVYHLPLEAIDYCLRAAGCGLEDVDYIAYSFSPDERARRSADIARAGPILGGGYETVDGDRRFLSLMRLAPDVLAAAYGVEPARVRGRWTWVNHHLAHMASAFYPSPFETAAGIVVDGVGESATTTIARCTGTRIETLRTVEFPHSIGFVWELMTNFLGFEGNYDECKVMGLAGYGDPSRFIKHLRGMVRPLPDGSFEVDFARHQDLLAKNYGYIERLLAGVRRRVPHEPVKFRGRHPDHADVAAGLQGLTNDVMVSLARLAAELTGYDRLVLAGGVALNAVANGHIARSGLYEDVWIQPAASDAGTALGAALWILHSPDHAGLESRLPMATPYLGPAYDDRLIADALDRHRLQYRKVEDPASHAAHDLVHGRTVGWFQGRMEFGPRALGNRSLLADPRLPGMRCRINERVKHRQSFRPFAPTVLAEHVSEWFDMERVPTAARFMLLTCEVRPERREQVPAIQHIDGSARIQALRREDNPLYHRLIETFYARTGVPMVLNTSFNDREPIVCTPDDAARCFLKTNIDVMYLGSYVVEGPKPWERENRAKTVHDGLRAFDAFMTGDIA